MILIKRFVYMMLIAMLVISQKITASIVQINNATDVKLEIMLDIIAYPDPQKIINKNSTIQIDIGSFFMRGISVGVHLGDYYIENVMSEYVPQTLGFGDLTYYIFSKNKSLGRTSVIDSRGNPTYSEHTCGLTFYLVRCPKFLYSGGICAVSDVIKVRTSDFENFSPMLVPNTTVSCCTE